MPSIPITSPLGYAGVFFVITGFFLITAGLDILKIQIIAIAPGKKTWAFGLLLAVIGILFLMPDIKSALNSTLDTTSATPITEPKLTIPLSAVIVQQETVNVSAKEYWYDTGINVQKGDWLEFIANGSWWSGISTTGPDGDRGGIFGLGRPSCGGCPLTDGNLGELVGKIDNGSPFRIGSSTIRAVSQDGKLLLAMNENTGPCKDGREGSCYDDNNGVLEVIVTVRRIK